jgi:hypothetical protein
MSLKSLFIKEEGEPKPSPKTGKASEVATPVAPLPTFSGIQGMVNEKILSSLKEVIKKNNITGVDYYEFSQAIEQLNTIIPDEKTKMLAAFATLKSSGDISKTVLISSIDTYISLIAKEKEGFSLDLKKRYDETVGKKKKGIEDAQKRITELQKELTDLTQFTIQENQNMQQEELKLKQIETNFEASITHFLTCLNSDKEKINLYIS